MQSVVSLNSVYPLNRNGGPQLYLRRSKKLVWEVGDIQQSKTLDPEKQILQVTDEHQSVILIRRAQSL